MTNKIVQKMRKEVEQVIKLESLTGYEHRVVEYNLNFWGYYFCMYKGKKTEFTGV